MAKRQQYIGSRTIAKELAKRAGCSIEEGKKLLRALTDSLVELSRGGECVVLDGFGTFQLRQFRGRVFRSGLHPKHYELPDRSILKFKMHDRLSAVFDSGGKLHGIPGPK